MFPGWLHLEGVLYTSWGHMEEDIPTEILLYIVQGEDTTLNDLLCEGAVYIAYDGI